MTVSERLSRFTQRTNFSSLPKATVHEAKRRIIDTLGCAVGAYDAAPVKVALDLARPEAKKSGATILGTSIRTIPGLACFVNGTMMRYLDYNDTYLSKEPAHPSDNLAPVLAIAEIVGASGKDLITALVIAYEVQCRLCDAASLRVRGWDHVTYGAFSSTLGVGKLLGLSVDQMVYALGLAGVSNIALRETRVGELSMWKACAFANVARNAVFAALMAQKGMTAPRRIFEGEKGFWKQVSGKFNLPPFGGRHKPFKIHETAIKFFPAEYHSQTAIEAALRLRPRIRHPREIRSIEVETFEAAAQIIGGEKEKWHPHSRETADHSLPYLVAVALVDGSVGNEQFTDKRIRDPKLHELVQKVKVRENPRFTLQYPKLVPNRVRIRLDDGTRYTEEVKIPRGHPKNPMADREVDAKFRQLSEGKFGRERVDTILERLWNLEGIKNIGAVTPLFQVRG